MRISLTLSLYIGRHFLVSFLGLFLIFVFLILLFDVVELMRRAAPRPHMTLSVVMEMAFLKLPTMAQKTFPLAVLFGAMAVFWRLTRSHELAVTRGAGVSAWQFLLPVLVLASLLGVVQITALNPLASSLLARYDRLDAINIKGQKSLLALSDTGLWLRQSDESGQSVLNAASVLQNDGGVELRSVTIFTYQGTDHFVGRIDAEAARLEPGFWRLRNAWLHWPEKPSRFVREHRLETDLTIAKIQDSFAPPETMSFWDLPAFIGTLQAAGFSALRHRLHWHSLLASPLLMFAMVLIGATFTLRQSRRGGTTFIIAAGALTGFVLHFFSDVAFALGLSDSVPVTLAAWTPSGVSTLLGVAMMFHLEDG